MLVEDVRANSEYRRRMGMEVWGRGWVVEHIDFEVSKTNLESVLFVVTLSLLFYLPLRVFVCNRN